uniref:Uncharacterized protein n=1 Tax=Timema cristinae TaxID=61476 RepID=A0A7R9D7X0_TIMCR|nr:unnamed protein product [Timema cristinae]
MTRAHKTATFSSSCRVNPSNIITWESVANIVLRGRTKLGSMFWMTSKDHSHWKKYLTRLFENKLFSDPKNCLLFFPPILHSSRKESELASFVNEKMGPSCSMLTLKVEGVIGTDTEDKVFEVEDFIAFSGLLLPAMPGVTVRQFHLCKKKVVRLAKGDLLYDIDKDLLYDIDKDLLYDIDKDLLYDIDIAGYKNNQLQ